jgi:transposase
MSTSLLYHAFGLRGYDYVNTKFRNGEVTFTVEQKPDTFVCPSCNSRRIIKKGKIYRKFRSVPIGNKPVWIRAAIQRVHCLACDIIRQVELKFADARRTYTKAFERYVIMLSRYMTIKDVAILLKAKWDMIKDIQKRYLLRRFYNPKLSSLSQIAIDEISIGKGHRYLTIVLDLKTGAVVFVGDGKGADSLKPFWRRLKASRAKIEAVAIDMSIAYVSAVQENLSGAAIVFDHFHVVKLANDTLSQLRRELHHYLSKAEDQKIVKGTRWLLLKAPENLRQDRQEKQLLEKALEINKPLAMAYYLKEDLRELWKIKTKPKADKYLVDWVWRASRTGIRRLTKLAQTIGSYKTGILAWFDFQISTGPLEGTNNKIKTLKRQAYGFRDLEFFKLKIKAIHESRYALIG